MKRVLIVLSSLTLLAVLVSYPAGAVRPDTGGSAPLATVATGAPAPVFAADKCATCQELLQACRSFCGTTHVNFSCQNSSPCAGTCTCQ
jgi:hypothetical protein